MKTKVALVYCQHGDERFGALVSQALSGTHILSILGNPRAFMKGVRCINTDLNRSYGDKFDKGYEALRAKEIVRTVKNYDLVIDIHTSYAAVGDVAILARHDESLLRIAAQLGISKVAIMPDHIAQDALIGVIGNGISIEYGSNSSQNPTAAKRVASLILRAASGKNRRLPKKLQIYYIKGLIPAAHKNLCLQNYVFSKELGGYPFLFGETRYKTYAGFFAERKEEVIIGGSYE